MKKLKERAYTKETLIVGLVYSLLLLFILSRETVIKNSQFISYSFFIVLIISSVFEYFFTAKKTVFVQKLFLLMLEITFLFLLVPYAYSFSGLIIKLIAFLGAAKIILSLSLNEVFFDKKAKKIYAEFSRNKAKLKIINIIINILLFALFVYKWLG